MKVIIIGGTGLIGSKLVKALRAHGHDAVAASPDTGVNTITGEGLDRALEGADVVVDVTNSPSFEDAAVMSFFTTSTRNLIAASQAAGVGHYLALSVVGTEKLTRGGYFRAKAAQESLIRSSSIPYTIVHATQFFEFMKGIAAAATDGDTVRLPPIFVQPMAADDVAAALGHLAVGAPANAIVEIAGPEEFRLDELVRTVLSEGRDSRQVVTDPDAAYFGVVPGDRALVPARRARLGEVRFRDWLARTAPQPNAG